jgi:hypothetical protein
MRDFHNLKVWQKGHELALAVYEATRGFPQAERLGLPARYGGRVFRSHRTLRRLRPG